MTESASPIVFTPAMLADRWAVSERHVRKLADTDGRLRHFRLGGKLMRFSRQDVEEYERCLTTESDGSKAASSSPSKTARYIQWAGLTPRTQARLIVEARSRRNGHG